MALFINSSRSGLIGILKQCGGSRSGFLNVGRLLRPFSTDTITDQEAQSSVDVDSKLKSELEKANQTIASLKQQNSDLEDKYKRSLADAVNIRKRMLEQIEDAKLFGIQNFCKDLLDVADVLHKAVDTVPKNEINQNNHHLMNLHEGLLMIGAQLNKVFQKHSLEPLNPLHEKFNPNFHEALFQQDVEGHESGTVINVSKIGYKLHNRVIRPALVGVAK